ncbi:hypothetical protein BDA99DRAFT_516465 [Phascolomyces articulosus]|uniref:BCAS3 WD40 domain-containing protein n=1 Tax=Phascolomyces articulosus TaxID=60185 RepID=A0AAD5JVW0_9FUNG|nr:hypothetical protein BDA99DRAFT_516465 [Phascolomyces articulosus]
MSQPTNVYSGVRAEPRFLRDPTSLEFISSGLSRFSSYVASNLPKRKPSFPYNDPTLFAYHQQQHHQPPPPPPSPATPVSSSLDDKQQQEIDDETDNITYSAFQKLDGDASSLCLLLGYADGFQVWNIANPDNIHEICSIRDEETYGVVSYLHVLANPSINDTEEDPFSNDRPLLAVVSSARDTFIDGDTFGGGMDMGHYHQHGRSESISSGRSNNSSAPSTLRLYSLKTHRVVKEFPVFLDDAEEEMRITNIQSNGTAIVIGCTTQTNSILQIISSRTLSNLSAPIMDVAYDVNGPVFSLGSRFLAYGTSSPVLNADPVMGQHNKGISGAGLGVLQGDKDVKGAAKDIAKEVVSGVKTLGEFGYQTLSNYFNNQAMQQQQPHQPDKLMIGNANQRAAAAAAAAAMSPVAGPMRHEDRAVSPVSATSSIAGSVVTAVASTSATAGNKKPQQPSGMIMIRDVAKLPNMPTRNMSPSLVAHFRPHTHPLSCLAFNDAGTLLMSASKQGHSFHIFAIMPSSTTPGNVSHLYTLARGYTDAQVEDCHFSADSMWCSVSTARGTTHVYAINPYGGKPEITGHVNGRVNNPIIRPWLHGARISEKGTSINSVARIKQRRVMYNDPTNDDQIPPFSQQQQQQHIPTSPYYPINTNPANLPHHRGTTNSIPRQPRAKLASIFLLPSKSPYLVNVSRANLQRNTDNYAASSSSFKAFKQQASSSLGSMLSSFGSSISSTDSSSSLSARQQQQQNNTAPWTSAHDKLSDNRLFGFDEEELSAVDDDSRLLQDDKNIGYQDIYSIHPRGILTLHRCWISKSVVRKREQARTIEKLDLVVKQEDVAEWAMARTAEWEQVKIPLTTTTPTTTPISISPTSSAIANNTIAEQLEQVIDDEAEDGEEEEKEPQQQQPQKQQDRNNTPAHHKRKHARPWLSHAEIMTYATGDELPLWSSVQFSLQTYSEDVSTLRHKLWTTGELPASKAVVVRRDMPEPYSRRIDRVGKTSARISSPNEENLDDALAELEDNLSKAMQTTFTTPSPTALISGSYGSGSPYKRNGYLQQPLVPGVTGGRPSTAPSAISFEDAQLISMGSGPSPEDLLSLDPRFSNNSTVRGNGSSIILPSSSNGSLIQFEDDDSMIGNNSVHDTLSSKDEAIRLGAEDDEEVDVTLHHPHEASPPSSVIDQQVFSPDGDNEMAYPSESIIIDRDQHHF